MLQKERDLGRNRVKEGNLEVEELFTAVQYESFIFSQSWRMKSELAFWPDSACLMAECRDCNGLVLGVWGGPHQAQWFTVRTKVPSYLTDKPILRTPICSILLESQLYPRAEAKRKYSLDLWVSQKSKEVAQGVGPLEKKQLPGRKVPK